MIGVPTQLGIIITAVARYLFPDEMGQNWLFPCIFKLYFGHHKTIVVAMKFVDLKGMITTLDEPARLVDDALVAERHELFGIVHRDGLLELVAGKAPVERRPFDGDKSLVVADADADGSSPFAADVALADVTTGKSLVLVRIVKHEEFTFNL